VDDRPRRDTGSLRVIVLVVTVFAAILLYLSWPASSSPLSGRPDAFTVGTAILVVGYVFYPALAFIAIVLLVVTVMLLAGPVVQRRRRLQRRS
jgi:hypothetical protein